MLIQISYINQEKPFFRDLRERTGNVADNVHQSILLPGRYKDDGQQKLDGRFRLEPAERIGEIVVGVKDPDRLALDEAIVGSSGTRNCETIQRRIDPE